MCTFWRQIIWVACFSNVFGTWVSAQELGLDFSDTGDFRPTVAFVGMGSSREVAGGEWTALKMPKAISATQSTLENSTLFSKVMSSTESFDKLSENYSSVFSCREKACLQSAAEKLQVHFLLLGELRSENGRTYLRVTRFDRFNDAVDVRQVATSERPNVFHRDVAEAFLRLAKEVAKPMARLKVTTATPGAWVMWDARSLGPCPLDVLLPPGQYNITVQAKGFLTDTFDVRLEAERELALEANLVARTKDVDLLPPASEQDEPIEDFPSATQKHRSSFWKQPGLYVATAGVIAMAAGLGFGLSAQNAQRDMVDRDGDGVLDITRLRAKAAQFDATMSTVLWSAGGAMTAGGLVWLWVAPTGPSLALHPRTPFEGLTVGVSGVFP